MRVAGGVLLGGIILGACMPAPAPIPASPAPAIPEPSTDSAVSITPAPKWSSAAFRIEIVARTTQADSAAVDSLRRQATVRMTPEKDGSSTILAFEATVDSAGMMSSSAIRVTHLAVDSTGRFLLRDTEPAQCAGRLPEISPLLVRQLVPPTGLQSLQRVNQSTDSLAYSSCIQGVRVQSFIVLRWIRVPSQPGVRGTRLDVVIAGRVQADSSRELPMRFAGTISGNSSVVFSESTTELLTLESSIHTQLDATAGTARHQRFNQTVTYRAARDTAG